MSKGKERAEYADASVSVSKGKARAEYPDSDVSVSKGKGRMEDPDSDASRSKGKRRAVKPDGDVSRSKDKERTESSDVTPPGPKLPEPIIIIDSASSDTNKLPDDEIELFKVERHAQETQDHQNYPADAPSDGRDHSDDYMQQGEIDPSSAVVLPPGVKGGRIKWGDDGSEWECEEDGEDRIHGVHGKSRRFLTDRKFTLKVKYVF